MLKHKVLVVDDQTGIVSFLTEFFENKGYEVFQATNAKSAIKEAETQRPHIVLLDLKLGWGADGLHVLKTIKQSVPETRVIMMTSVSDEDVVKEAKSLGADDYMIKPFSLAYLEDVVTLKILNLHIQRLGKGGAKDEQKKGV